MKPEVVFSLVDRIYEAAMHPDAWQDFLTELSEVFGGAAAALALQLPGSPRPVHYYLVHLSAALHPVLERYYAEGLPWSGLGNFRELRTRFLDGRHLVPREAVEASSFYGDWMKPEDLAPEGPVAHYFADEDGVPVAGVALFRRVGAPPLRDADVRAADLLVPHLARAYRLYRRFGGAQHRRLALAEVIDRLPIGVVLVDGERRPVVTNCSADRIVAMDDGLLLRAGRVHAANARDDAVLQQLLIEAIGRARDRVYVDRLMAISRPSGKRALPAIIAPLHKSEPGDVAGHAVACVLFGDPDTGQSITPEILRTAYGLTAAESELVGLLAAGYCLKEAARQRGVSLNTVRSQLKQVFAKTDTNRQGELVRLVLTGAATFDTDGG